jgi:hypothetical protein
MSNLKNAEECQLFKNVKGFPYGRLWVEQQRNPSLIPESDK